MMTSLPVPEQWTLCKLTDREVAEEIEKLIDYVDDNGRSVHLSMEFVRHYTTRYDGVLPTVVAIATLPIVLADGGILGEERGLDEMRGISFIIPKEVMALMPQPGTVTPEMVGAAMKFLTDEWLVDVKTSYVGKCTIIAAALTILERSLLDTRPAFFVTAGRRGSGKTMTLIMLIKAVTGIWPAAAAWSANEEERRKALMSYFLAGVSYILWDNILRGTQISCPHIERSCTSAFYTDRRLGVSETVRTAAGAVHLFNGNAIGPKGDLASRSLSIWLDADRADPENRNFAHHDPVGWTDSHRAEILRAFYVIMLGNPMLKEKRAVPMKTRFKMWWRLVGSAIEHAADQAAQQSDEAKRAEMKVDFGKLFLEQEVEDEDDNALVEALGEIRARVARTNAARGASNNTFSATDMALEINQTTQGRNSLRDAYRACFYPSMELGETVSPIAVSKRLKTRIGEPVRGDGVTLILRSGRSTKQGHAPAVYWVEVKDNPPQGNAPRAKEDGDAERGDVEGDFGGVTVSQEVILDGSRGEKGERGDRYR
jgi:hypothetical protein